MCTVSFVPLPDGYVLTSNRDECPSRKTNPPTKIQLSNSRAIYCPVDTLRGGTWIAIGEAGKTACLLNGAFKKHTQQPAYRKSRGHFVIDAFKAKSFTSYTKNVCLDEIEPFTLLLVEPGKLQTLVWDGRAKHILHLPSNLPYLWSSCTLYTPLEHIKKEDYFTEKLGATLSSTDLLLRIHGKEEVTPFILNHDKLKTVSITQVIHKGQQGRLKYFPKETTDETAKSYSLVCR